VFTVIGSESGLRIGFRSPSHPSAGLLNMLLLSGYSTGTGPETSRHTSSHGSITSIPRGPRPALYPTIPLLCARTSPSPIPGRFRVTVRPVHVHVELRSRTEGGWRFARVVVRCLCFFRFVFCACTRHTFGYGDEGSGRKIRKARHRPLQLR
jgi:hypothetical protein